MKKNKFIIAFFICWLVSSITLFFLNIFWPSLENNDFINIVAKSFGMSILIIVILYLSLFKKKNS
ncbi:MAG: hypothetical protein DRJ10_08480 [Bacteroidetes bacterium]|nr:MAG: hypothetical protein DRJ10_08480 [Bacteroidota bacterium]